MTLARFACATTASFLTGLLLVTASGCGSPPARDAPLGVVLVTLDTVRADRLGCYGGDVATPALDRIAREGIRFEQATTAAPLTLPAHATILSGTLPPRHGLHHNGAGRFPKAMPTLATRLSDRGFRTGAFVGAFVLDRRFGLARGFETYDDQVRRGDATGADALEAERSGGEVVDRALAWLRGAEPGRPYFLWVHLFDAHAPYEPPAPYRDRYPGRAYDGEIAYVDAQVGRILEEIDRRGEGARSVVAVVADHGEALGEHGEQTHGLLLYQPTLRVPWLIRAPGVLPPGSVVASPVSLADVAPTVASLAGAPLEPAGLDGRDLIAALERGAEPPAADVYSETEYPRSFGWAGMAALRRGAIKRIRSPRAETFDLARDPGETHDLGDLPSAAAELDETLAELVAGSSGSPAALDPETRERLASLGYVGGAPTDGGGGLDPKDAAPSFRAFEEAHRALRAGRVDEAAAALDALVRDDPRNPAFRAVLAQAERRRGRLERAVALHREAVSLRPDDGGARYELALALQEAGQVEEAATALEEAIRREPAFPEAHNALGIALAAGGRAGDALREFDRAVELDPRDSRAHHNRGNALRELGRPDEAAAAYDRAIAIDPEYADPHAGLGAVALARDDPARALAEFERAIALAPGQHEIRVNRGIALELLGRPAEARESYRSFLAAAGDAPAYAPARDAARKLLERLGHEPAPRGAAGRADLDRKRTESRGTGLEGTP